ncbi:hypothetical protein POF51_29705 [Brevibacillus sp. AG]|uniref:hypothetical protein n=1 Tax=Brevibacillus sp. AG TaxID=3020891 RepID=UPI0023313A92|nr:hypothetical protein [Brevibacillus sp. AG]MDC0764900.1 hypothetical protein [Brevibacillus sp. AG]
MSGPLANFVVRPLLKDTMMIPAKSAMASTQFHIAESANFSPLYIDEAIYEMW